MGKYWCMMCDKYHKPGEPEYESERHYKQAKDDWLDYQADVFSE